MESAASAPRPGGQAVKTETSAGPPTRDDRPKPDRRAFPTRNTRRGRRPPPDSVEWRRRSRRARADAAGRAAARRRSDRADALPTGSIAVPQLDAIAPIEIAPLPVDDGRPSGTSERRIDDSRLRLPTTDSRLPTREGAPVLTRTAVLAALLIATVPILAQPPASTPPPGQAPRTRSRPRRRLAPTSRVPRRSRARRHPRQPPPRAARVSRSTSRWNSRCPITRRSGRRQTHGDGGCRRRAHGIIRSRSDVVQVGGVPLNIDALAEPAGRRQDPARFQPAVRLAGAVRGTRGQPRPK